MFRYPRRLRVVDKVSLVTLFGASNIYWGITSAAMRSRLRLPLVESKGAFPLIFVG